MRMLEKNQNIVAFVNSHDEEFSKIALPECLSWLLPQYNIKKEDLVNISGLNQIYACQISAGMKKPSRDKLIALMFGYALSADDGNMLLKSAG